MKRREFIKTSALATAAWYIPGFLNAFPLAAPYSGKRLVIVQLSGGNDGLNTVVPYGMDAYYQARPTIGLKSNQVLLLNTLQGLHPALASFKALFDEGHLTLINNVGYPNPDRSHFRSMDIWHSASGSTEYWSTGWLGRYLDALKTTNAWQAIELDDTLSLALKGVQQNGFAAKAPDKLLQALRDPYLQAITAQGIHGADTNLHYLYKVLADTESSAGYLLEKEKGYKSTLVYPAFEIGRQFRMISSLIGGGSQSTVYYVSHNGFDTHVQQLGTHQKRLEMLGQSLDVFVQDLKKMGAFDDTLIMVFSEFGRRVQENGSKGTDHGTANALFLIGGQLSRPGIWNEAPNLADLDDGDLIFTVDFRDVYAEILKNWLGADDEKVLQRKSKHLGLFK